MPTIVEKILVKYNVESIRHFTIILTFVIIIPTKYFDKMIKYFNHLLHFVARNQLKQRFPSAFGLFSRFLALFEAPERIFWLFQGYSGYLRQIYQKQSQAWLRLAYSR